MFDILCDILPLIQSRPFFDPQEDLSLVGFYHHLLKQHQYSWGSFNRFFQNFIKFRTICKEYFEGITGSNFEAFVSFGIRVFFAETYMYFKNTS